MKTSVVRIAALLLCTAMAPAISTPAWAQSSAMNAEMPTGDFAATKTLDAAIAEADSAAPVEAPAEAPVADTSDTNDANSFTGGVPKDDMPSYANKPNYYDPYGNPYSKEYGELWPMGVLMGLQRDPNLPTGHFVLFMSMTKTFVGCLKVSNPKYGTEFKDGMLIITLEKYTVDQRDMPRYPHYQCNMAPQEATIKIPLSKQLLTDNAVKKIKFRVDKTTETYNVKMTDEYIQLISESRQPPSSEINRFRPDQRNQGITNPLKFWFYPENTFILSADGISKDITMENDLVNLARSKGLTPLNDIFPDHKNYRKKADMYYFVDKDGRYKNVNNELFDYLQVDAMRYGLEADEPIKKNVAVFIRKPGQYE